MVLFEMKPATRMAAYAAARATRDVTDAFYHAAGDPASSRWREAIASVESFLSYSRRSPNLRDSEPLNELAAFVKENSDLLAA
jgi:hypothetical protein